MAMKLRGLDWWMIGLLTLGTVMNYLARSTLSVAAPTVMTDLHITTQQYGWITGAFLVMYPIGAPATGYLINRVGFRFGFLLCGVMWSIVCIGHGFAGGWVFVIAGCLGLVWAALWIVFYRHPSEHKSLTPKEAAYIVEGEHAELSDNAARPSLRQIFSQRNFLTGVVLLWTLVRPAFVNRRTDATVARPANA